MEKKLVVLISCLVIINIIVLFLSLFLFTILDKRENKIKELIHHIEFLETERENENQFFLDEINLKQKEINRRRNFNLFTTKRFIMQTNKKIEKKDAIIMAENIITLCEKYKVSYELIISIIWVESRFDPNAKSSKNARGLMQVMPFWVNKLDIVNDVEELHLIDKGIEAGIQVFQIHLSEVKNDVSKALFYYVGRDSSYVDLVHKTTMNFILFKNKMKGEI